MPANSAPTGHVTLVFTDVQGSTVLWEHVPDAMRVALATHDALMRELIEELGGYEVKTEGDAFMVSFSDPLLAIEWCAEVQKGLLDIPWPPELLSEREACEDNGMVGLRVRIGVHAGEPDYQVSPTTGRMDYFGPMVNRAARIAGAAHGGQILISESTWELVRGRSDLVARHLGQHHLKGLRTPECLIQVLPRSLTNRIFPPPRTVKAGDLLGGGPGSSHMDMRQLDKAVTTVASSLLARSNVRYARGHFKEGLRDLETALSCSLLTRERKLEGNILGRLGRFLWRLGRTTEATEAYWRALDISHDVEDKWNESTCLTDLSSILQERGDYTRVEELLFRALDLNKSLKNHRGEGVVLENLGLFYMRSGHPEKTYTYYQKALNIYQAVRHPHGECLVHVNMGMFFLGKNINQARSEFEKALLIAREIGDKNSEGIAVSNLGNIHLDQGHLEEAELRTTEALRIYEETGSIRFKAISLCNLALIYHLRGKFHEAREYYLQSISLLEEYGDKPMLSYVTCYMGSLEADLGIPEKAREYLRSALAMFHEVDDKQGPQVARICQGVLDLSLGNKDQAKKILADGDNGNSDVRIALRILENSLSRFKTIRSC